MKFVTDVGEETHLATAGHGVKSIFDVNAALPDDDILTIAKNEPRIVVTMDFGELVFRSGRAHTGVLLPRLEGTTRSGKADVLHATLTQHADKIEGHVCVFQNGRLQIRYLGQPLLPHPQHRRLLPP